MAKVNSIADDLQELQLAREAVLDVTTRAMQKRLNVETTDLLQNSIGKVITFRIRSKGVAGEEEQAQFRKLDGQFCSDLERKIIPALADCIFDAAPVPGERSDTGVSGTDQGIWLRLIEIFTQICDKGRDLCGLSVGAAARKDLSQRLANTSTFYHKHLMEQLQSGEHPDIAGISADQLRLDILHWGLEQLGDKRAMQTLRSQANSTARAAIKSAERIVNTYFSRRGVIEDFEFTSVLAEIEELVVLINRSIEADLIANREEPEIVHDLGHAAVARFVDALGRAILAVFKDIEVRISQNKLSPHYMEANLKKAQRIYEFCQMVDRHFTERVFVAVKWTIDRKSRELMNSFTNMRSLDSDFAHVDDNLRIMQKFLSEIDV